MKTYQSSLPRKKIYLMLAERTNNNSETLIDMTYEGRVSENDFKLKLPSKKVKFGLRDRRMPVDPVMIGKMEPTYLGGTEIKLYVRPQILDIIGHVLVIFGCPLYECIVDKKFYVELFWGWITLLLIINLFTSYIPYLGKRKKLIGAFKKNLGDLEQKE